MLVNDLGVLSDGKTVRRKDIVSVPLYCQIALYTHKIEQSVSKDNRLRGLLLGMVIGHFTEEEFQQFVDMEGEVRRRITNLITQRLQSQMKALL